MVILLAAAFAVVSVIFAVVVNTFRFTSRQVPVEPLSPTNVDKDKAIEHLSRAVQFKTISNMDRENRNDSEFTAYRAFLAEKYPLVHEQLTVEHVNERSLLYTWRGAQPALHAVLLMGHMDVVPIEPGTEGDWTHGPFDGTVADGYVWGRGSWDNKCTVMGLLEAVEILLREGHKPQQDIYIAFGHDEEIHGMNGAAKTAELLRQRGARIDFVLDEGAQIATAGAFNATGRVAMIGISEKGYMSVELVASAEGGHSSKPPVPSAIELLTAAITALQKNPMQASITPAIERMFDFIGPELPLWRRAIMANRWLFGWWVKKELLAAPNTRPVVRTTSVPTVLSAGIKDNVVPRHATGVVNFRILTGQTVDEVLEHARRVVNDPRVVITPMFGTGGPTAVKELDLRAFTLLSKSIRQVFPDAIVAPTLLIGRTDSRHFEDLAGDVYRFTPIVVGPEDAKRLHGTNERIGVDNFIEAIQLYRQLILNISRSNQP